jgi:hypothetical protein
MPPEKLAVKRRLATVTMAADAHAFRAQYDATMRQLQFNSKPLIDALTLMAESNPHFAGVVVDAIRDRATRVGLYGCWEEWGGFVWLFGTGSYGCLGRMGWVRMYKLSLMARFLWRCVVSETMVGGKGLWPGRARELDIVLGQPAMQRCGLFMAVDAGAAKPACWDTKFPRKKSGLYYLFGRAPILGWSI